MSQLPSTMRAAVYYNNRDVRLEERPVPRVGPGGALVRVEASGICGTDILEWYRLPRAPLVLGHEVAGTVVEVAPDVSTLSVGDRVVATHHVPCNTCYMCLRGNHSVCDMLRTTKFDPGGFCEYLRLEPIHLDRGVIRLPDAMEPEMATFTEPLGCVLRGLGKARIQPGMSVCVIGSGITGLLHLQASRALGAGLLVAVDVLKQRLDTARRLGAELVLDAREDVPARLREVNHGRLADSAILCAGKRAAFEQALRSVERGGTLLVFAPIEAGTSVEVGVNERFFRDGVTITSSYAANLPDLTTALELIRTGRVHVKDMVTHRLPLAETEEGFRLVQEGASSLKVIVEPQR